MATEVPVTRVLIVPQEFKGSLTAREAAEAIAAGVRAARPHWVLDVLPLSDGGPGFIDALGLALGAETVSTRAHDALGRPVQARYAFHAAERLAIVEAAEANGLVLVNPAERDAVAADTFGVGELLLATARHRPRSILVGVGGSATTDGGAGMARALGARLLDADGRALGPGGGALGRLARIEWDRAADFASIDVVVATDVTNPLTGPRGAAAVYAPQKGASPPQVDQLDAALVRYAAVVRECLGVDIEWVPGGGAAGGLAAGLVAFLGGTIRSGFEVVSEATSLESRARAADIVITGEGSFDSQSTQGKTTGRMMEMAQRAGKPCVVVAGRSTEGSGLTIRSLEPDPELCMTNAALLLERLAASWAESSHPST